MKFYLRLFICVFFLFSSFLTFAQGCSDAGVCSIGSLGIAQYKYEKLPADKNKLELVKEEDTQEYSEDFDPTKIKNDSSDFQLEKFRDGQEDVREYFQELTNYNVDSLKNQKLLFSDKFNNPYLTLNYSFSYGIGDNSTAVATNQIDINYRVLNRKLYAQLKIPYLNVKGNLGTTSGLGDLTFSLSYIAINKKNTKVSLVGGVKLPTNNSDFSNNNKPLPMIYQTSLGSTDGLFGFNVRYNKWDFTFAYQQAFTSNKNQYLHSSSNDKYDSYFESKNFKRAPDAVFRFNRSYGLKKVTLSTGVLFIYHLANDKYTNLLGERVESKGSEGLTINLNFSGIVPLSKKFDLITIFAAPIKTRNARPDGLTREFVVMGGLRYNLYH